MIQYPIKIPDLIQYIINKGFILGPLENISTGIPPLMY